MKENKEKSVLDKADVIWSIHMLTTHSGLLCRGDRTTQEIQLKEKTQGSDEILNITTLAIVLDQG